MASQEQLSTPYETISEHGITFTYDPTMVLRPDGVTTRFGAYGTLILEAVRLTAEDRTLPVAALEVGSGPGISGSMSIAGLRDGRNAHLAAFDISPHAVEATRRNILAVSAKRLGMTHDVFVADWFNDDTWKKLGDRSYDVIMFNPPYLLHGTPVRDEFQSAPRSALYVDEDVFEHYRQCIPKIIELLSDREGASFIIRFPKRPTRDPDASIPSVPVGDEVLDLVVRELNERSMQYSYTNRLTTFTKLAATGVHVASYAIVTRGTMMHDDPLFHLAYKHDLARMPRSVSELEYMLREKGSDKNT